MKNGLSTYIKISRRHFIAGLATLAGGAFWGRRYLTPKTISGNDFSPNHRLGHLLRSGELLKLTPSEAGSSPSVIIIGGGIAGLSAGWWLERNGFTDFEIWELEKEVGGNSRFSKNEISSFPWGAHYVPLPNDEAQYVRLLFEELNIITGYAKPGVPIFNDLYLCSDPQERLFHEGRWHESLIPSSISDQEKNEVRRFLAEMAEWRSRRGKDGKRAFTIPVALSSQDDSILALDQISFSQWLDQSNYRTPFLRWYLDYSCRDDYGQDTTHVSAWAGLHYFAGRNARSANSEPQAVLTWPNGNGWLVDKLRTKLEKHIRTQRVAFRVETKGKQTIIDSWDPNAKKASRHSPKKVILATPRFIAAHLLPDIKKQAAELKALTYSPWLVANITLKALPEGKGAGLAWDNVSYYGRALGYIVSTHQNLHPFPKKTVITFYFPLDKENPETARLQAYHTRLSDWQKLAIEELSKMHKGIESDVESVDVCIWGHGMITPTVGFLWGDHRKQMAKPLGNVHFAHSDMSGLSIFEEAQYHGVTAAEGVLKELGGIGRS